ncbi:MAG: phage portal protein, partial [Bacillota bacterium]
MGILDRVEVRSTLARPASWLSETLVGRRTLAGVRMDDHTALTLTAVYNAIAIYAKTVGALPLKLYERLEPRGKREAPEHPLYAILHDAPNPEMPAMQFRETLTGHLIGWGNAYAEIEFDAAGRVRALWPLLPHKMRVERDPQTNRLRYIYTLPDSVGGRQVELPPERVLHIPGFGYDGTVGYNPIRLFRENLGIVKAAEEYGARFFGSGARPSGVLQHPGKLSPEAQARLRENIERLYGGLENSHRI